MTDDRTLVERLGTMVDSGRRTIGGGTVCHDGSGSTHWGNDPIMVLRNPDGPEAASTVERQAAEIERLTAERDALVVELRSNNESMRELTERARKLLKSSEKLRADTAKLVALKDTPDATE